MRRLTVVQLLPALESGGVERSTLEIAQALVAAGHRSIVVSAGGRLVADLRATGSEHIRLALGRKSLLTLRHVYSLRHLFAEFAPDIVHARSRLPAWLAWLALRGMAGVKPHFVTTVHGLNSPGVYSGIMARGERVICVSQTVRAHVLQHWPQATSDKLEVIERGLDPAEFFPGGGADPHWRRQWRAEFPALAGGRVLLLPGRGTRRKGHLTALKLVAALRRQGRDARLWLLGAREPDREAYFAELEAATRSLGLSEVVVISLARPDIAAAYAVSDLVVQLSEKPEAFGRTVIEALSVGTPVVAWAHGGVGELLRRHYPAGAVPYGDTDALVAAVGRLLDHAPPTPVKLPETLAAMQAKTLELYESLSA